MKREKIGFLEAWSIGVGGMIGGGIFAVLGLSLLLAGTAAPLSFLFSGLVALATGYSYAKLSVRYPSEGGTIEYLVRAYGPGLLSGALNIMLLANYTIMIALYAYAFGSYTASLLGGSPIAMHAATAAVIAVFTAVNGLGAAASGGTEDVLVAVKLAILALVAAAGLARVDWGRFNPSTWPSPVNILAGGMIIFLAYEGFELISNTARDIEDPKILPKAFYTAIATVTIIYTVTALVAAGTLTPRQIIRARDYALAEAAKPALGEAGSLAVTAAALLSTSSAINATLYGAARISYMVAKHGQLPPTVTRRVWRNAREGLIAISLTAAILAEATSLETISTAGSAGFLLTFTAVNAAALKLRKQTRANPLITAAGAATTATTLLLLLYKAYTINPAQPAAFTALAAASITAEAAYRAATGRRIASYIDNTLREREENIRQWRQWLPKVASKIREKFRDAEIYLVGSIARGELHAAHDVDVLVVTKTPPATRREENRLRDQIRSELGLTRQHPIDIHFTKPENKHRWLKRGRRIH